MSVNVQAKATVTTTDFAAAVILYDPDRNYEYLALIEGRIVSVEAVSIKVIKMDGDAATVEEAPAATEAPAPKQ